MRAHIKEKRKLILGKIMQKTNLNKKALRRTARRAQERRTFKPAALAKAMAGVFVCGALIPEVWAVPGNWPVSIEIGGYNLTATYDSRGALLGYVGYDGAFRSPTLVASEAPTTWSFKTSEAFENLSEGGNDIDLTGAYWKTIANGGEGSFVNDTDHTVKFVGTKNATAKTYSLIDQLAIDNPDGTGGYGQIVNSGNGTLELVGSTGYAIRAISSIDNKKSRGALVNEKGGTVNIYGMGTSDAIYFCTNGTIDNAGTLTVLGDGIYALGEPGAASVLAQTHIINHSSGVMKIQGSNSRPAVQVGLTQGYWAWTTGIHVDIQNEGLFEILGGSSDGEYGIETIVKRGESGCTQQNFKIINDGVLKIKAGVSQGSSAINNGIGFNESSFGEGIADVGNVTIQNKKELIIQGALEGGDLNKKSNGIDLLVYGPDKFGMSDQGDVKSEFIIENSGTMSWSGSQYGYSIGVLTDGLESTAFVEVTNRGIWNLNKYAIGTFGPGQVMFTNTATGTIQAEAGAIYSGNYEIPSVGGEAKPLPIQILSLEDGVSSVTTDAFSETTTVQTGVLTLKDDWKNHTVWEDGGTINFTDVAAGTELAESIKSQFQAAFGTGTTINFTGTGSSSGSGSSTFNMDVVNALISEGKLAAGSVVTSEALTHSGKTFTLGNTGDMTQDTGFMGIKGSTGITVKDGKTLTLMGSQASMAMAVGADTRDASYVITDAPMAMENGTLKLGHKAMSATEGTLADVTFDRMSTVNVENGIYTLASLKGEGLLNLSTGTRTDVTGELSATQVTNAGTLTVAGQTVLGAAPEAASTYAAPKSQTFVNENGATANLTGGLVVNDFATVKNKTGATINAGAVTVDTFGVINNYEGATLAYASVDADGIVRNLGTLNVTGTYAIGDEGETTFAGDTKVGTLSIGRTAKTMLMARDGQEAVLHNTGKTYADELDLVSGQVMVEKDSILAGKSLKNGAVGSDIIVSAGGTFGFSHDKSSLENALKNYTGSKADKAILALNTDLHFGQGGSLTVGSVDEAKGTVNLGSEALLLLGTTQLHGEALLNGESSQHLHVEDGAVIAMTDDLLWGNHYLMKGFDDASTAEILKVGILDKDGKALGTKKNDKGIFVTVGSDNILEKDKSYRMVNQMNWLLDGRQDLTSEHGDVAFLTSALVDKYGASATNRMEALAMDAGVMAETQRMGAQVQTTMLDHASSARKGYGTFWVDGIYSKTDSGDFARSTGASAYEADTTGFAFGADLPLGDDSCRLGVAFSAQRGDLNGNDGLSSDIKGYGFSVYGGKTFESGLNVTGALTYMAASHEVSEYNLGRVKADIDADMWVLGARMSMPFGQNRMWMTPYLGIDVMKLTQDGFTSSWFGMEAFRYSDVDATIVRTPVGVKAGTFMPLELFGRSGTLNWDADISFIPQFGDKDADFKVSGISNGHSDGMSTEFVNDWLSQAKFGMSYQGAAGAFGLYYAVEKGDVRDWSSSVNAKASLFF